MYLETFIWSWVHLHPGYIFRRLMRFLGLAALVLIPLFYSNVYLTKQGFKPSSPSLELQASTQDSLR